MKPQNNLLCTFFKYIFNANLLQLKCCSPYVSVLCGVHVTHLKNGGFMCDSSAEIM